MSNTKITKSFVKEVWYSYLTTGDMPASLKPPWFERKAFRPLIKRLPKSPRCDICYMPFEGIGGWVSKSLLDVGPSKLNPRLCNLCERYAEKYNGGVELEISILFVDVRGSTTMAEARLSAILRAAAAVRLPVLVCSIQSLPFWIVNSISCISR